MPKKAPKNEEKLNYNAEVRKLRDEGVKNLYLLWGPEDYLRELYLAELKKTCLPEGEDDFSYRRMDGPDIDLRLLGQMIDSVPFLSERTFIEVRDAELNKIKDKEAEKFIKLISDIPDYCTVAFVQKAEFEPDSRLKPIKSIKKLGSELKFTSQSQDALIKWIVRRFAAAGKSVELPAANRLIFISGDLMSRLIPEIEKVAAYAKDERVTVSDVEAVANHLPEADIFEMTEFISQKNYNAAASVLAELLADKNNEPIMLTAMLGMQMRRLYASRLAIEKRLGTDYVMSACSIRHEFVANKLLAAARGFELSQLKRAVELCAETDYAMKSSGEDDTELLKELVVRIAAGEKSA